MTDFYGNLAKQVGSEDESEVSDVDPAELAKMVEDVDDLDAGLFGSASGRSRPSKSLTKSSLMGDESLDSSSKLKVTFEATDNKAAKSSKNVRSFDDFDSDDLLGDLLSDEDGEFSGKEKQFKPEVQQHKELSESTTKNESTESNSKQTKAKVIAELFGLDKEKKEEKQQAESKSTSDWLGLEGSNTALQPEKPDTVAEPPKESTSQGNEKILPLIKAPSLSKAVNTKGDDDLLEGLGFGREHKRDDTYQSKSKLDELLGKGAAKFTGLSHRSLLDDMLQVNKSGKEEDTEKLTGAGRRGTPGQQQQQQASAGKVAFGSYSPSVSAPSGRRQGGRRGSAGGSGLFDPLGIFSPKPSPNKESLNIQESGAASPQHTSGDWLPATESSTIVSSAVKKSKSMDTSEHHESNPSLPEWLGGSGLSRGTAEVSQAVKSSSAQLQTSVSAAVPPRVAQSAPQLTSAAGNETNILAAGTQMDHHLAASLQHQETQLLTALNLKQHEERLIALQHRQQEILNRQELQLEELIRKQIERQEQLDTQMRSQQERINAHIQMLLAQPPSLASLPVVPFLSDTAPSVPLDLRTGNKEPIVEKTEEEIKKHFGLSLQNLKSQHEEELRMLKDSYRRQVSFLESALEKQEQRLHMENERLTREYNARLSGLEEELKLLGEQQQKRLITLRKEHSEELLCLREMHRQNMEEARRQQAEMLEHLNKTHAVEKENIKDASLYSRSLAMLIEQLKTNTEDLSTLNTKLDEQQKTHLDIREAALHAKEAELKVVKESLEKQKAASEEECKKLLGAVSQLEQRLVELRQQAEEDRWHIKQEAARIDAANQALERERERITQQLDAERQQLQMLKNSTLKEQETVKQQLQQEKLHLAAEKSRLETLSRLHGNSSPEISKMKTELETALKVVQEAKMQVESEREKLWLQEQQLNDQRIHMEEKERNLVAKSRENEMLSLVARTAKEEGRKALEEARRLEQQHSSRATDIQRQLAELREREKRLVQEKMILAQQQLALQNAQDKQLCIYCRKPKDIFSPPSSPLQDSKRYVDPKLIIMKLIAEDDASHQEQESQFLHSVPSASK